MAISLQKQAVMGSSPFLLMFLALRAKVQQNRKTQKMPHGLFIVPTVRLPRALHRPAFPDSSPRDIAQFMTPRATYTSRCHPTSWRGSSNPASWTHQHRPACPPRGQRQTQPSHGQVPIRRTRPIAFLPPNPTAAQTLGLASFCTCLGFLSPGFCVTPWGHTVRPSGLRRL